MQPKKRGSKAYRRACRNRRPYEPGCPICDPAGSLRQAGGVRYLKAKAWARADGDPPPRHRRVERGSRGDTDTRRSRRRDRK